MYWKDVYAQHEQQLDRQREAEERRRAAALYTGRPGALHRAGLAWLGRRMVAFGQHLDTHYGSREVCDGGLHG